MSPFLTIKNLFKSITYVLSCLRCFVAKILMNFYQKAVVFSETTYYHLRKLRSIFVFVPTNAVFTL
jgi:hypothetical protein